MNTLTVKSRQQGFVLPVGMVMLLILTIIGVNSMRDGIMQEKMTSNFKDKEVSLQGAESALRIVEYITLRTSAENIAATTSYHPTYERIEGAPDYKGIDLLTNAEVGFSVPGVYQPDKEDFPHNPYISDPVAMIEEIASTESLKIGKEPVNKELAERYYRITTQSNGETDRSRSTLQSVAKR